MALFRSLIFLHIFPVGVLEHSMYFFRFLYSVTSRLLRYNSSYPPSHNLFIFFLYNFNTERKNINLNSMGSGTPRRKNKKAIDGMEKMDG